LTPCIGGLTGKWQEIVSLSWGERGVKGQGCLRVVGYQDLLPLQTEYGDDVTGKELRRWRDTIALEIDGGVTKGI